MRNLIKPKLIHNRAFYLRKGCTCVMILKNQDAVLNPYKLYFTFFKACLKHAKDKDYTIITNAFNNLYYPKDFILV